jgi:putative ABC transport system permease protein
MGVIGFYMPEPLFKKYMAEGPAEPMVLLSARLTDPLYSDDVFNGFNAFCNENGSIAYGISISLAKFARTMITSMISMIIVAFAVIITTAALIVIHFRISDTIRDDIKDIGILKAMGYTGGQIKASVMLQFLAVAFTGGAAGIFISYLLLPFVSKMFSFQTGLIWEQGFSLVTSASCLLIILSAIAVNVYGSMRRMKYLHPVMAIREDTKAHNARRNYFRLDKTKSGLQFSLACKLIMQNFKQNVIVALIIATVTYASAFGLVFYYNMAVDSKTFIGTIGGELCSVAVGPAANLNAAKLREEIGAMPEVRKAIFFDGYTVFIGEEEFNADITEDFSELEGFMLYDGNYPKTGDEVAISGIAGEKLGKAIGDSIRIGLGNEEEEYLISGFIQSGNYVGKIISLTDEGVRRIAPDFVPSFIYIYLEEGEPADVFIEQLENRYGSAIYMSINLDELLEGQTRSYVTMTTLLAVIILLITAVIVTLILYFVIKTMVVRRRRDFGVQKALGYTTFQLVEQIALSFLPIVAAGSAIGAIAGCFGINPMISALFKGVGIMRFDMVISLTWMILLCAGIILMSYAVAILISYRIRKISAYILITE